MFLKRGMLVLAMVGSATNAAWPCSCIGGQDVKDARKVADAVFIGTVIGAQELELKSKDGLEYFPVHVMRYTLRVERSFKGRMVADEVVGYTGLGGGDCGFRFTLNERFIVYGDRDAAMAEGSMADKPLYGRGIYWTNICTRTRLYDDDEVRELEVAALKPG